MTTDEKFSRQQFMILRCFRWLCAHQELPMVKVQSEKSLIFGNTGFFAWFNNYPLNCAIYFQCTLHTAQCYHCTQNFTSNNRSYPKISLLLCIQVSTVLLPFVTRRLPWFFGPSMSKHQIFQKMCKLLTFSKDQDPNPLSPFPNMGHIKDEKLG